MTAAVMLHLLSHAPVSDTAVSRQDLYLSACWLCVLFHNNTMQTENIVSHSVVHALKVGSEAEVPLR